MTKPVAKWTLAMAMLTHIGQLWAHHSLSSVEISTPIWVTGTVVDYKVVHPHVTISLEEALADGRVQRWTVEGPSVARLGRMGLGEEFLKRGARVEVCGFALKSSLLSSHAPVPGDTPRFVHGHLMMMPDGRMQPWGPYGDMRNCVRAVDQPQTWRDFLDSDAIARDLWCARHRATPTTNTAAMQILGEINAKPRERCG